MKTGSALQLFYNSIMKLVQDCVNQFSFFYFPQFRYLRRRKKFFANSQIGDTSPGKYRLRTRGLSDFYFENSTEVQYVHKSYSVFIQTDRAVYKPGSKVMFRAVVLDSRLRPAQTRQMDIYIAVSVPTMKNGWLFSKKRKEKKILKRRSDVP